MSPYQQFTAYEGQAHFSTVGWGHLRSTLPNSDDYEEVTAFRIANKLLANRPLAAAVNCT